MGEFGRVAGRFLARLAYLHGRVAAEVAAATARKTGRTSKTLTGARRQTIVVSVLESLRLYLPTFTLSGIIAEIDRWRQAGQSCFTRLLKKMKLPRPTTSILDKVMPVLDG